MPTYTIPAPYPLTDDTAITSSGVNTLMYNGASPADAWNIVNGYLDQDNMDANLVLTAELTQRGTFVDGWGCAGTANLDYRAVHFAGCTEQNNTYAPRPFASKSIPGACRAIYLPRQSLVRISWTIGWTNDNANDAARSRIVLYVDGDDVDSQVRQVDRCANLAPPDIIGNIQHYGYRKNRWWSGHNQMVLAAGWHDIGLRIQAHSSIPQTRVWARHIDIIAFTL